MKFLLISDSHFHAYKSHASILEDGSNSRFIDIKQAWEEAVKDGWGKGCECLLFSGDMFHTRGVLKPSVFNEVFKLMAWTAERMRIILVAGNHDMEAFQGGHTAIDTFDGLANGNIDVIKAPCCTMVGDIKVGGIPYIHDIDEFKRVFVAFSNENTPDITLIHQGVDGFGPAGMPDCGITVNFLQENNGGMIVAGHYHDPKVEGRVVMCGAPCQHSFSDEGSERGYWIYDTETSKRQFYPLYITPEFITLDGTEKKPDIAKGSIIRIKTSDAKVGEKMKEKCIKAGVGSAVVVLERKFATAHDKTIPINTPKKMLIDYLELMPEYSEDKGPLLALYEKVCG
jgi:DNA repair exonuclease SbcCD nuclease subunit